MYTAIDNSDLDKVILYYQDQDKEAWQKREFARSVGSLLEIIDKLVKEFDGKVKGLAVVLGKGRFTATRVATTAANTLGFAWQIPVVGVVAETHWEEVAQLIKKTPVGHYIIPAYSSAARIGTKSIKSKVG